MIIKLAIGICVLRYYLLPNILYVLLSWLFCIVLKETS